MNFFLKKHVLTALVLLISIAGFAFPVDPDPTNDPPAPIDSGIYILLFFGVTLAACFFSKKNTKA